MFFIGRLQGGLGIKKPSNVYRATRISNLVNMLNHEEENIRYIARESLSLDMRARGVRARLHYISPSNLRSLLLL